MEGEVQLGEVAEIIMGQSPPGETYNEHGDGLPFFQGVADFNYRHPTPRVFCTAPSRIAIPGDILLSVRAPIGRVNVADRQCAIGRGLAIIRPRVREDGRYLEFALRMLETTWTAIEGGGSVFGNATRRDLETLRVPWPESEWDRRAIAHILGTLDDKIELNRRMSETLEQMARALFKSWFVDFEPVRAKMEGRWRRGESLPGLPAHLYDPFPDRLVESELGEIPEGWPVGCVDDTFNITMGQSPPGTTYNEAGEGIPFYQGRADFKFRFPERRVFCTAPTRFAKAGDTLISVRAPVGDINMAFEDCAIGRGVAAARHKSGARSYTYYFMHGLADVFSRFEAEGTVFGSISKKDFHAIQCVVAPQSVIDAFERLCSPIDDSIERAERESRTLAAMRDALLPKLISRRATGERCGKVCR
ncbi:MAG: type I restriction system specificity protein [Bacteroidia bacterium]|nr:MAG: type I restriction system specificity protein [Bacteroidia bacterium]